MKGDLPADWAEIVQAAIAAGAAVTGAQATRASSQVALNVLGPKMPEMVGGSADLTGSVNTAQGFGRSHRRKLQRQLHLLRRARIRHDRHHERPHRARRLPSVRRHVPGVLRLRAQRGAHRGAHAPARDAGLHARLHRPGRRRSDAPAHRAPGFSLRAMPNLHIWRPCDAVESAVVVGRGARAQERSDGAGPHAPGPAAAAAHARAVESRCARAATCSSTAMVRRKPSSSPPARKSASRRTRSRNCRRRASACAWCRCRAAKPSTRSPRRIAKACCRRRCTRRLAVEAGATQPWWRYVGSAGRVMGIDSFGASGKGPDLFKHFGLTAPTSRRSWNSCFRNISLH